MQIRSIEVDGIRGLPERSFALHRQGETSKLVCVTGPPASGKSTFLEAIVAAKEDVGSYGGEPDPHPLVRPGETAAKIRVDWELAPSERERFGLTTAVVESETLIGTALTPPAHDPSLEALLSSYEATASHAKVEYFHAGRRLPIGGPIDLSQSAGDSLDRMFRLRPDDTKYGGLMRYIVESGLGLLADAQGAALPPGRIGRAFDSLCHSKRLAGLYKAGDRVLPGFTDAEGSAYGVAQLSDSERDVLLFATTFVRAGLVDNEPGSLILIDTPERHLGDAAAGAFVKGLAALGPQNQLIVATTSRAVADAAGVVIQLGSA